MISLTLVVATGVRLIIILLASASQARPRRILRPQYIKARLQLHITSLLGNGSVSNSPLTKTSQQESLICDGSQIASLTIHILILVTLRSVRVHSHCGHAYTFTTLHLSRPRPASGVRSTPGSVWRHDWWPI